MAVSSDQAVMKSVQIFLTWFLLLTPQSRSEKVDFQHFENSSVLRLLVNALHSLLNNCVGRYVIVDSNMILGLSMTAAQLQVTLNNIPDSILHPLYFELNHLRVLSLKLIDEAPDKYKKYSPIKYMKRSEIWKIDKPNRNLNYKDVDDVKNLKFKLKERILNWSKPSPNVSNYCIDRLFNGCKMHKECIRAETTNDNNGYELTHQILYWLVFRQINCSDHYGMVNADEIIEHKCSRVLQEIYYVTSRNVKYPVYQDLFLEQVILCGIENYEQFLTMHIKKIILGLQTTQGCFAPQLDPLESKENLTLVTHIHALATTVLAVQIRDLIISKGVW